ncbi:MAG: hypothetical protein JWN70_625 [Planctomycetaceae bacterium]|nr:hypothetical protein [Planctomycetaceae bacterium]
MSLEHKAEEIAPFGEFIRRLLFFGAIAGGIIFLALGMGVCGYHYFGQLSWIDALVNAAMILGGMGPVDKVESIEGKLFATFYALFSGLVFVASFSLMVTPVAHRVLHKFHVDDDDLPQDEPPKK